MSAQLQRSRKHQAGITPVAADRRAHGGIAFGGAGAIRFGARPVGNSTGAGQTVTSQAATGRRHRRAVHRTPVPTGDCHCPALDKAQRYLLPQTSDIKKRISENTLNGALHRMGYANRLTGHGIRATISTALNELGYRKEWIEVQLSHVDPNQVRAAYNHAAYVEQRRQMMQDWADLLDRWENGEPVNVAPATHSYLDITPGRQGNEELNHQNRSQHHNREIPVVRALVDCADH